MLLDEAAGRIYRERIADLRQDADDADGITHERAAKREELTPSRPSWSRRLRWQGIVDRPEILRAAEHQGVKGAMSRSRPTAPG
jgi:hypothetical protein